MIANIGFVHMRNKQGLGTIPDFAMGGAWQAQPLELTAPLHRPGRDPSPAIALLRRGGREVECAALEMRFTGNRNVGSNPTLSARIWIRTSSREPART